MKLPSLARWRDIQRLMEFVIAEKKSMSVRAIVKQRRLLSCKIAFFSRRRVIQCLRKFVSAEKRLRSAREGSK